MEKKHGLYHTLILFFFIAFGSLYQTVLADKKPLTIAESSNYTATSRYEDVLNFIQELQKQSEWIRVETLCTSTEGRNIPLLIIGNPVPASPNDLRNDERGVVYIQANIHAGEVEGKEASLMLVRDILQDENHPFLDKLVILIAPIFNADGNEKISPQNRSNQKGPSEGVGVRYNGQELDLNRDAIKLESPEVKGMVQNVLNRWDPFLLVDCHTTNGSYHHEPVTYTWAFNPNGDNQIMDYMRKTMMPFIKKNMEKKYNVLSVLYGNFMDYQDPEKGWETAGPECRYITNYIGLRNRLSILNENYSYADYKTRVWGCYSFLQSVLQHCSENKERIQQMVHNADQNTIQRGLHASEDNFFAVEYEQQAYAEKLTIEGYEMEVTPREGGRPRVQRTDKKRTYHVPYFCKFEPTHTVPFPAGYFIDVQDPQVAGKLREHGVAVEVTREPVTLEVEVFHPSEITGSERLFQGHHLNKVKGEYKIENRTIPAGTYFVSTAQKLGMVAAYLLEPESDDGLLVWNFFDRYLVGQWQRSLQAYPVYRLLKPVCFVKEIVY
jgi:hypothetical protein